MTDKLLTVGFVLGILFSIYWTLGIAAGVWLMWGYDGSLAQLRDRLKGKTRYVPFHRLAFYLILSISLTYICS